MYYNEWFDETVVKMAGNPLKIRRSRYAFNRIEGGEAFDELKRLSSIPNHKQLTLRYIYGALEEEINHVKNDINCVYQAVRNDIKLENEQMETVEHQLKKSVSKMNHMYDKILANRSQNNDLGGKNMLENLFHDVNNITESFKEVDNTVDSILITLSQIDARITPNNRLLNGHGFNEQHYPLLFGLMHQKFGDQLTMREQVSDTDEPTCTLVSQSEPGKLPSDTKSSDESQAQVEPTEEVSNLITKYRISQEAKATSTRVYEAYLPPSLRKISAPSTKTTFETITAQQLRDEDFVP